jgi:hypothetical protein
MSALLRENVEHVHEYSIDELFILLPAATAAAQAVQIQRTMGKVLGLPVSATLDAIHNRYGTIAIGLGHNGLRKSPSWVMHRDMLSPRRTTRWADLLTVR